MNISILNNALEEFNSYIEEDKPTTTETSILDISHLKYNEKMDYLARFMIANFTDKYSDLHINGINLKKLGFEGNVNKGGWTVDGNLHQGCCVVNGNLYQSYQKVGVDLYQGDQEVNGGMYE